MAQRWIRPRAVEPGHWKAQLPAKILKLGIQGQIAAVEELIEPNPAYLNRTGSHNRALLWEATRNCIVESGL